MTENTLSLGSLIWYPFEKNKTIYLFGKAEEEYGEFFASSGLTVIDTPKESEEVDYILYTGMEASADSEADLRKFKTLLKPDGHLLMTFTNRLGLQYFCGERDPFTGRVFDGIENYRNYLKEDFDAFEGRLYSRADVEAMLDQIGLSRRKYYSILPGLMMPQQIYAQGELPNEELAIRYSPLYEDPSTVFVNQGFLYDEIIKNGLFHTMANAYLFDISPEGDLGQIKSVTTSLDRGKKAATATVIYGNSDEDAVENAQVEKKALFQAGNASIKQLFENTNDLNARGIKTVPLKLQGADGEKECLSVSMPFVTGESALTYLRRIFWEDFDLFLNRMDRLVELIRKSAETGKVYIDLVPLNAFYQEDDFLFFDQEFAMEDTSVNALIIRAIDITYMGDRSMEQAYPKDKLFERYGITSQIVFLREVGNKFIRSLRNEDMLSEFRKEHWVDSGQLEENRNRVNYTQAQLDRLYEFPMKGTAGKRVYIFGTGRWAETFAARFSDYCNIVGALDNNAEKVGLSFAGKYPILSPSILEEEKPDEIKVIVCIKYCTMILQQLKKMGITAYSLYDPNREWKEEDSYYRSREQDIKEKNCSKSEPSEEHYGKGYVAGVFDLFHMGHLNVLRRAREHCDYLIVGVVSDAQASQGKAHSPYVNEEERLEIVRACKYVDQAFILPLHASGTRDVYRKYHFDAQFSGSDYEHDENWLKEQAWLREHGSDLVFFPYTDSVSSTKLKEIISKNK